MPHKVRKFLSFGDSDVAEVLQDGRTKN